MGFVERTIPDPGFPDDDGSASEALAAALAAHAADSTGYADALAVVQDARLLVPVVAVLGEVEYDDRGLAHDKTSDMAAVLMQGADGRMALLAFSGNEALARWNPEARPVPVLASVAAQAAVQDQASALVIDVAGPATFVVEGDDLVAIASGWRLVHTEQGAAWIGQAPE